MRRGLFVSLSLAAVFLAGCPSKPKNGECKSSDDCKDQAGFGKVCVQGRCQECAADGDCKAGFACRANKCAPRPECERNEDCGAGKTCDAGRCIASAPGTCTRDQDCGPGQGCEAGRCTTREALSDDAAAAAVAACGGDDHAVYFAFDSADLDQRSRSSLDQMVSCLKNATNAKMIVEGHCDDRGTTEYNLHLGERRAESVKRYLTNLGVSSASVRTTSYGKERPVCRQQNEDCWSKNRRGVVRPQGADRS